MQGWDQFEQEVVREQLPFLNLEVGHVNGEMFSVSNITDSHAEHFPCDIPYKHYDIVRLFKKSLDMIVRGYMLWVSCDDLSREKQFDAFVQRRERIFTAIKERNVQELIKINREVGDAMGAFNLNSVSG